ncbi:MAG: LysE family translocator [Brevinema sp.]
MMKNLWQGFGFGMIIQIAVGPVCLTIFALGINAGFWQAWMGALGALTADIIFVALALLGVGTLMKKQGVQQFFQWGGALLILAFGLELILSPWQIAIFPRMAGMEAGGSYLRILVLTLSNPMAIIFWIGVFSVKIAEIHEGVYPFAGGALLATLFFLTLVAALSAITRNTLPSSILVGVNVVAGILLFGFGLERLIKATMSLKKT